LVASRIIDAQDLVEDPSPIVRLQAVGMRQASFNLTPEHLQHLLTDSDLFVRFAKRKALEKPLIYPNDDFPDAYSFIYKGDDLIYKAAREDRTAASQQAWSVLDDVASRGVVLRLARLSDVRDAYTRAKACAALGRIAYQPKPYDGHWWGTQPVKTPPPLNPVPWAGTPGALAALTAALSDPDVGVRLAAAKAFTQFAMPVLAPAAASPARAGAFSDPSAASSTAVTAFFTPCHRLSAR
jgi:HEAT repeat protein